MSAAVIVVGGGLAGHSAAHTVLQAGGRVVLLDKSAFNGGNSTKATSGINGGGSRSQRALGIADSAESFEKDTLESAAHDARPHLVRALTHQSAPAVEWLMDRFDLDLSVCSRLGGASFPRTHRAKDGTSSFPGMMITYRLIERLEEIADSGDGRVRIENKANVRRILRDGGGAVVGVEYEKDGTTRSEYGPVVIATGGFGADFSPSSLLAQVEPQWRKSKCWEGVPLPPLTSLPTTNGPHCTGDGIKMAVDIGADTFDMHAVQVHPTGLVEPKDPDSKVKWLAAEALRGCGGLLLTNDGQRFADELGHRDYVTGRMWTVDKAPYRLVLNSAAAKQISWHCDHYSARGLMKKLSGAELAAEMGISEAALKATFDNYNHIAETKSCPFGKKFFNAVPVSTADEFHVAIVTPTVHYTMGGIAGNEHAQILDKSGAVIPGLYGAGEVLGGIHGSNRLGGSSLLDCVVFGRIAGQDAARYLLDSALRGGVAPAAAPGGGETISAGSGSQINISLRPDDNRMTMDITWNKGTGAGAAPARAPPAAAPAAAPPTAAPAAPAATGKYTLADVAKHTTEDDCWVAVNGNVYDVTPFLDEHPGGKKTILIYAGKDASKEFNMMHQPEILTKYGPKFLVGELVEEGSAPAPAAGAGASAEGEFPYEPDTAGVHGSTEESWTSGGTAGELPAERAKGTFDIELLTNVLDGGPECTKRRRWILSPLDKVPAPDKHNMDRHELMEAHVRDFIAIHKPFMAQGYIPKRDEVLWMSENTTNSGSFMPHMGLFVPTIIGQASPDQQGWWLFRALNFEMVGSYAQTELGHGSNVRGLRTIAEYDPATQEFVLNTPTLQSMKWWNSNIGLAATHAAVYAQLIIKGKEYGVHVFMVQLRDEHHRELPGVEAGDVGNKLGDHGIDTGYLRLTNVRIPREHIFSKRQHVEPDGTYVKHSSGGGNSKAHYLTMMQARAGMIQIAGGKLAIASTIATRYSCVRRQGFTDTSQGVSFKTKETQIIDYQLQQFRLMKQVSTAYAIKLVGQWMNTRFEAENLEADDMADDIVEVHAASAGLKGLCSFLASEGIEDCRKCCGGHGYLLNSGVAALAADYVWQTTAEGDFIVLLLQTARYLIKAHDAAVTGKPVAAGVDYLEPLRSGDASSLPPPKAASASGMLALSHLLSLFRHRALLGVSGAARRLATRRREPGMTPTKAWNASSISLASMSRSHCYYFMLARFVDAIDRVEDGAVRGVMTSLAQVFALSNIVDGEQWAGILDFAQMELVQEALVSVLAALRPNSVAIVDAFDIKDRILGSALGRHDGNVYEQLYLDATRSKLNHVRPFRGYKEFLQPELDIELLKTHNGLCPEARL